MIGNGGQDAASIDWNSIKATMREMSARMSKIPNRLITTKRTFERLKQAVADYDLPRPTAMDSLYGTPVEAYDTVAECLDRMHHPLPGERLQLVLSEDIPIWLSDHPWIKGQAGLNE